ncbi:HtaA domain-containing protein, partial [Streptomyces murinus]|uniref:HtaA domain-containing protein n=1 Tax=Streptomyces murinus TaxID=33900 RepID=UPI001ABF8F85
SRACRRLPPRAPADGTLGWGVKETFRTYVVSGPAQGKITTSGGAKQASGNGAFTFPGATGSYDTKAGTLSAAFKGAVNFKGHESNGTYGLDLTLSDLHASLNHGTGTLTADVTSLGKKSEDVVLADLKAKSTGLTAKNDVITVNGVTATLTDAGAKAFSGYYTKGTALDPVALSVALTDDADLPSGDGGTGTAGGTGGSGTAGGAGTAGGSGTTGGDVTGSTVGGGGVAGGSLASTGSDAPVGALGAAAAVAVVAGAGVVVAVRRRRTAGAEA